MVAGPIVVGIDLGIECGYAEGAPGTVPFSAELQLKRGSENRAVALGNLLDYLAGRFATFGRPAIVAREAYLPLAALLASNKSAGRIGSAESVDVPRMMAGIVDAACVRFGLAPSIDVPDSTWRKHFVGIGRAGDREASKRLALERCWQLGYLPRDCFQTNRAEALGVWDWACSCIAHRPPVVLAMFPPQREKKGRRRT